MDSKHQVVSFGDRTERGAALAGGALACVLLWATTVFGTRATLSHLLVPTMGVGLLIAWRKLWIRDLVDAARSADPNERARIYEDLVRDRMRRLRLLRIAAPAIVVPSLLLCYALGVDGNTVLWLGIAVASIGVLSSALAAHVLLRRAAG